MRQGEKLGKVSGMIARPGDLSGMMGQAHQLVPLWIWAIPDDSCVEPIRVIIYRSATVCPNSRVETLHQDKRKADGFVPG